MFEEMTEVAPFVWRLHDTSKTLDTKEIGNSLISRARNNPRGIARLCFHSSDNSKLHIMVIGIARNTSFPIHMHKKRDETLVHLVGRGKIKIYDGQAWTNNEIDFVSGTTVLVPALTWHGMSAGKTGLAFLEIRMGPLLQTDTVYRENNASGRTDGIE